MKDIITTHFKGIKLFPEEEILDIQRQHVIALILPLSIVILFIFIIIGIVAGAFYYSKYIGELIIAVSAVLFAAVSVTFLLAFSIYIFMQWYYQFYIFTNKRLIHVHFFRIGGFHLDEILHERTEPLEIDREPQNFILDFLGIEDVYVYFHRFERPEPFIFKMPSDSARIEELLEDHLLKRSNKEK